jgi:CMP-N,N'-diacetyllegionaminic acid synthase
LPDKNIRPLNGVPLIAYSIKAALDSGVFDTVMVSTDSEKYAEIARNYGAEVPFLRSEKNSSDTAGSWDVVKEVLDRYEEMGTTFDSVTLLQPTSPMRLPFHIQEAYRLMEEKKANAIVSVCENEARLGGFNVLPENLSLVDFLDERSGEKRRQVMEILYRPNGSLYLYKVDALRSQLSIYDAECYAYVMGGLYSTDVDTLEDFQVAEALMRYFPQYQNLF